MSRIDLFIYMANVPLSAYSGSDLYDKMIILAKRHYDHGETKANYDEFYSTVYECGDKFRVDKIGDNDLIITFTDDDGYENPAFGYRIRLNDKNQIEVYRTSQIYVINESGLLEQEKSIEYLSNIKQSLRDGNITRVDSTSDQALLFSLFNTEYSGASSGKFRSCIRNIVSAHQNQLIDNVRNAKTEDERNVANKALATFIADFNPTLRNANLDIFSGKTDSSPRTYGFLDNVDNSETTTANIGRQIQDIEETFRIFHDALDGTNDDSYYYQTIQELRENQLNGLVSFTDLDPEIKSQAENMIRQMISGNGNKKLITEQELEAFKQFILEGDLETKNSEVVNPTEIDDATEKQNILNVMATVFPDSFNGGDEIDPAKNKIYQGQRADGSKFTIVVTTHSGVNATGSPYSVYATELSADGSQFRSTKTEYNSAPILVTVAENLAIKNLEDSNSVIQGIYSDIETNKRKIDRELSNPRLATISTANQNFLKERLIDERLVTVEKLIKSSIEIARRDLILNPNLDLEALKAKVIEQIQIGLRKTGLTGDEITSLEPILNNLADTVEEANATQRLARIDTGLTNLLQGSSLSELPDSTMTIESAALMTAFEELADDEVGIGSPYLKKLINDVCLEISRKKAPNHRNIRKLREYLEAIGKLPEDFDKQIKALVTAAQSSEEPMYLDVLNYNPELKNRMQKVNDIFSELDVKNIDLDLNLKEFYELYETNGIPRSVYEKNQDLITALNDNGITTTEGQREALLQLFSLTEDGASIDPEFASSLPSTISDDMEQPDNFDMKKFRERIKNDPNFREAYNNYLYDLSIKADQEMLARFGVFHSLMLNDTYGPSLDFISSNDDNYDRSMLDYSQNNIQFYNNYRAFTETSRSPEYGINETTLRSFINQARIGKNNSTGQPEISGDYQNLAKLGLMFGLLEDPAMDVAQFFTLNDQGQPIDSQGNVDEVALNYIIRFDSYTVDLDRDMSPQELQDRLSVYGYIGENGQFNSEKFVNDLLPRINGFLSETVPRLLMNPESFPGNQAEEQRQNFARLQAIFGDKNLRHNEGVARYLIRPQEFANSLSSYVNLLADFEAQYDNARAAEPAAPAGVLPAPAPAEEANAPAVPPISNPLTSLDIEELNYTAEPEFRLSDSKALDILLDGQKQEEIFGDKYLWA